jgi:transcriptional regulator with XRE-family HTH domain
MNGRQMKELRKEAKLYQSEFARELNVDERTIRRWEKKDEPIPAEYEFVVFHLVGQPMLIASIKGGRKPRIFGRPFCKKIS